MNAGHLRVLRTRGAAALLVGVRQLRQRLADAAYHLAVAVRECDGEPLFQRRATANQLGVDPRRMAPGTAVGAAHVTTPLSACARSRPGAALPGGASGRAEASS